jgi:hypothetical protein
MSFSPKGAEAMKTIAEYFDALDAEEGVGNLEILGYGQFPQHAYVTLGNWRHWLALFAECVRVIQQFAEQPFLGGPSCARIIDSGMKRFLVKSGCKFTGGKKGSWELPKPDLKVPPVWIYTVNLCAKLPDKCE